ncbi:peptidoglycan glycosyltransferase FtsW [Nitratifractor salsuginis]|uniref:Probable peptidoglycan glycosyltransferase FtsW n=1 Tax=Nitratifractor salsuginis (strain DSM 16511 / JCM 12458 / E9I37-1) TaxID=749222 RepID=E6X0H7_NITSE|nr:putative peptidoglycan glycosyltransferase FtsW [Nitratifractor salsuginis]ADV46827.1 cell cycle protein [Nitratifractor salsuginis DSM 16511]
MSDKALFYAVCALFTLSLVLVYSLSTFTVHYYGYDDFHFFLRQLASVLLGIGIMVTLSWLDPDRWFVRLGFAIFLLSLLAMILMPFLPASLAKEVLGAKRWIRLGPISLAPVEFFKVGFVFFIAWSFSRKLIQHGKLSLLREFLVLLPYLAVFGLAVVLIAIFQKDLGQVVVLAATMLILTLIAGRSLKFFFTSLFLGLVGVVTLILIAPHRMRRIKSWWSTVQDHFLSFFPQDMVAKLRVPEASEPYQIANSLNAIHNGGWLGQGLGNGQFKLGYLSEVHTDFVLAGLTEELGFVTLILVAGLLIFIIFRLLQIASRLHQPAYYLFTVGVALLILFAFIVNSYGIAGVTPIKGIAVPFLSYGGSQILASSVAIGMVLMVSKKIEEKKSKRKKHG